MKKHYLFFIFVFSIGQAFAQTNSPWKLFSDDKSITSEKVRETSYSENQKLFQFNSVQFKQLLANVNDKASGLAGVEVSIPNVEGKLERFMVWESSNFEPELQARYPEIRAYVGKGITDPSATLNFSLSPLGIQTMVLRAGVGSEFIEAYTKDRSVYVVFDSKTRIAGELPLNCSTQDVALTQDLQRNGNVTLSNDQVYRTMRLALSCTAEYTTYFGGTVAGALAGMNATMTRCNGVFERDLAVKLLIIANNDLVIFTNATTDPYSAASVGTNPANTNNANGWNIQLQNTLTNTVGIGNGAYDIGHLFGASGGGGNAGCIGCVCVDDDAANTLDKNKGSAYTSPSNNAPEGDTFDIDYVAHEMGHQMGANHTFTWTAENNTVNVEPGSGSTIMAYAGVASPANLNVQPNSDDYFTYRSINQIQVNLGTKTCPVSTSLVTTNPRPTVLASGNFSIPIGTAFKLTGSGTGTAGEVLTYCWEQNNDATVVGPVDCLPSPTKTDGPNFRSFLPSLSPVRYMPQFSDVLNGNLTTTWETVSTVARSLNFVMTVRDNVLGGGQTNTGGKTVTVVNTGAAFAITNPSTSVSWGLGSSQTLTWSVAGTTANGINTANVNILISTDGGANFTTLVANTPNDGSETITMPSTATLNCRILVEAVGNIFYAVSKNITLGYDCVGASESPGTAIADGLGANSPGAATVRTLNMATNVTINNMKASFASNHTWIGDLVVKLKHPDGTEIVLWNRTCNNPQRSGMDITFADGSPAPVCASPTTGTYSPVQGLSAFNGKPSNGTWTLTATDFYVGDSGSITSWGINFGCTLGSEEFSINDLTVYPNPNNGNFTVQYDNPIADETKIEVYDIRGRKIFENSYANQGVFNESIQLNDAQAGIYLLTVTDGNRKVVKRIAVE
ncbi:zinc-dependent metalloprotease [Flavobacterium terrisoli]|uniref:zinc-dependent metalloprotease n=1 Tax=Flavobacterium terrisoli TaxID=3242195 RepID=UPI002542FCBD|nr:zinc-dependent metalloprotease family protein [Flavobacterium buctense]